jgi:hypothetical protein
MATLTIRLSDEKHERLRQLAERRKISMNKLIDELSTVALTEFDAQTRFRARTALGSGWHCWISWIARAEEILRQPPQHSVASPSPGRVEEGGGATSHRIIKTRLDKS